MLNKRISQAYFRALAWILKQQLPDGSFPADFGFRHGASTSWSTAYVVNRLPLSVYEVAAKGARFLLRSGREHPYYRWAWGYNANAPADLDSTVEALRVIGSMRSVGAFQFLPLRNSDNGFPTYHSSDAERVYPGLPMNGWTSSHLEIATNLLTWVKGSGHRTEGARELAGMLEEHILTYLEAQGYQAYWYQSPLVAASFVLRAFGTRLPKFPALPLPTDPNQLAWETRRNPFINACAIQAALVWDPDLYRNTIDALATDLVDTQRPDGAWRALPVLRVPYSDATDPRYVQHNNADYKAPTITTATVMAALQQLGG